VEHAFSDLKVNFWLNARVGNPFFRHKFQNIFSCVKSNIRGKTSWGNAFSGGRRIAETAFPGLRFNLKQRLAQNAFPGSMREAESAFWSVNTNIGRNASYGKRVFRRKAIGGKRFLRLR